MASVVIERPERGRVLQRRGPLVVGELGAEEFGGEAGDRLGPGGWLALDFTVAKVDWDEVAELMEGSYR